MPANPALQRTAAPPALPGGFSLSGAAAAELVRSAKEADAVVDTFEDPTFGLLEWDRQLNCWIGGVDLRPGFHVEITVSGTEEDRFMGFPAAKDNLAWLRGHEPDARRQVAAGMVELYNDAWTDEDEPVPVEEFSSRIGLLRASLGEEGALLLSYSDGPTSLFGGHLLDAEFGPSREYRGTHLIG